jgi:nitroreductase
MGNSGFGHKVKTLLMVTVDRQCFFTEAERNQCWIDGGLFAMSLVYGLHSLGLGSCCLNWSVTRERDKLLKKVTGLKESDAVIMMIAVGHLKEEFNVATSARKSLNHFLVKGIQA